MATCQACVNPHSHSPCEQEVDPHPCGHLVPILDKHGRCQKHRETLENEPADVAHARSAHDVDAVAWHHALEQQRHIGGLLHDSKGCQHNDVVGNAVRA